MPSDDLIIALGESQCTVSPTIGGSLKSWHVAGQAMLRATPASRDPLDMASFPLVPYSNRIGAASFEWAGQKITLSKNFPPEPHALHGIGWQRPWLVESHQGDCIGLSLAHDGDDYWPWPFDAQQVIRVGATHLQLDLSVKNLAPHPVPLAFGHHPYFEQKGASLQFAASNVWISGEDALPTAAQSVIGQFDFTTLSRVEGRAVDNCYSGISGKVHIEWADCALALDIVSALPAAVVYVPKGGDAFCFEPVPHINNALNMLGQTPAMPIVEAGAWFETSIFFQAIPK